MIEQKKKYWREKVTAEITLTHVQAFAQEMGTKVTTEEVTAFLNQNGMAQRLWIHMMKAGEQYIKSGLQGEVAVLPQDLAVQAATIQ